MDGDQILLRRPVSTSDFRRVHPQQTTAPAWAAQAGGDLVLGGRPGGSLLYRDLSDEALRRPPPPSFSQDDLTRAQQEGFQEGYAAAHAEAAASRAAAETMALTAVASAMMEAHATVADVADRTACAFARAVTAAMRATVPELIRRSASFEIAALIAEILPGLSHEPTVVIGVAPDLVAGVTEKLARMDGMPRDGIRVCAEAGLQDGDARIVWGTGQASRQPFVVWQRVLEAFGQERLIAESEKEIESHDD